MKILHTSDLHLCSPLTSRLSPSKVRERKTELLLNFERMADEAMLGRVRLVIIAGDLFDSEKVTKSALERVIGVISGHPSIDFLYLSGNHEKAALTESAAVLPENLKIFGDDWTYFNYDFLTVTGRSTIEAGMFDSLKLDYARTNIVVLHGALADARTGNEIIGIRDASSKNIDYLALGHYHSYSVTNLESGGVAVYSGTPEGRGFDEVGEKGYVLIEADGKHTRPHFKPFAKRTVRIADVDASGTSSKLEIEDRAARVLAGIKSSDIVRLHLTGARHPELFIDTDALKARWENSLYHFEVKDDTAIRIDPNDYKFDKSLKGEFIRLVMSKTDLTDIQKDKIIRTGLAALMGEADEI